MMMKKETYKTTIDAPREKVWRILWDDDTYRQWTASFSEGSHAVTDWQEGSKVLFLGPDGNGMVSKIIGRKKNEFMNIEHLGIVKGGVEDTKSDEIKQWAGAMENYTLTTIDGKTELVVVMDIAEEYLDEFNVSWPQALDKVKQIAEDN